MFKLCQQGAFFFLGEGYFTIHLSAPASNFSSQRTRQQTIPKSRLFQHPEDVPHVLVPPAADQDPACEPGE